MNARVRYWIELGAWFSGLTLLLLVGVAREWSEHARAHGVETYRRAHIQSGHTGVASELVKTHRNPPDQSLWSKQRVLAFAKSASGAETPEGLLRIPSLKLEVPIYAGTSEINLNRGAAHIAGTAALAKPGNAGIAGHRDGFFRKLKDVGLDAAVYVDVAGRSLRYRVVDIRVVPPSDVQVLAPTDVPSITLVTCYPFYFVGAAPERYVVRAQLDDAARAVAGGS